MSIHIAMATSDEVEACARVIAEALRDDPVLRAALPGDNDRVARLTDLHIAELRTGALASGVIDVARTEPGGPIVGVAAWTGPEKSGSGWRWLRELPRYLRAIELRHLREVLTEVRGYEQLRPRSPHWYLADIAVDDSARGLGIGSALLRYRLAAIDAQALPAYLESTSPANRKLYERFGFEAIGAVPTTGTVAPTAMLRRVPARTDRPGAAEPVQRRKTSRPSA